MDEGQAEWQTEWNNAQVAAARAFGDAMPKEFNMAWNQLTHGHTLTFCDLNHELCSAKRLLHNRLRNSKASAQRRRIAFQEDTPWVAFFRVAIPLSTLFISQVVRP